MRDGHSTFLRDLYEDWSLRTVLNEHLGFPAVSMVENVPANAGNTGDMGSIPGWGRSPGIGNCSLLQYFCLGNPMDSGAWEATVHGVEKELDTTERLSTHACRGR